MWDEIFKLAIGNGLWAVLFCFLLFHLLRDSKRREEKYIQTINMLGEKLNVVNEIKDTAEKILKQTAKKTKADAAAVAAAVAAANAA